MSRAESLLRAASLVFWDFDGVIKESLTVKADGFERLFLPFGQEVANRVRKHHESHTGISRYEKMPLYLDWAGLPSTTDKVEEFCERFSQLVRVAVIEADWVPGVPEYLRAECRRQQFVLLTATPQREIEEILRSLALEGCFREVFGAPTSKPSAIKDVLMRSPFSSDRVLVVGDSESDVKAAEINGLACLLRSTTFNEDLRRTFRGPTFECLSGSLIEG
jgi:phosphoglycolate phosphatase-like HAD superfamily hydrolase